MIKICYIYNERLFFYASLSILKASHEVDIRGFPE